MLNKIFNFVVILQTKHLTKYLAFNAAKLVVIYNKYFRVMNSFQNVSHSIISLHIVCIVIFVRVTEATELLAIIFKTLYLK